ncbi:hypothetical protein Gorai_002800 [Gossypium raimondii]|uniref:RNase H type-1 domain-containing protein n=1 Tax=Gossypium raimondii TaxID=29730 RepID=A0A7J8QN58_GOSRA|nr:hypothetical protein [Gossypium raimondii]
MKAPACLQAIRLGLDLGLQEVIFEGDALTVVKKLLNNSRNGSTISAYIKDTKSYQWIKKGEEYLSYWWSVEVQSKIGRRISVGFKIEGKIKRRFLTVRPM